MSAHDDRTPARSSIDDIIDLYKKDVDRALLRENLKLTPDQRVRKMIAALRVAEAVQQLKPESKWPISPC